MSLFYFVYLSDLALPLPIFTFWCSEGIFVAVHFGWLLIQYYPKFYQFSRCPHLGLSKCFVYQSYTSLNVYSDCIFVAVMKTVEGG